LLLVGAATAARPAASLPVERTVRYGGSNAEPLLLDAFLPRSNGAVAAVVLVHGGGWSSGSRVALDGLARSLGRQGWAAFSVDYRLAPRWRFPAAFEDVQTAIAWVRRHALDFRIDVRRIALFGVSAGGNLALLAATRGSGPLDRGSPIRAVVSWSGPTDLTSFLRETTNRYATSVTRSYLGCAPTRCPRKYAHASPASFVDRSDPPTLLVNSTRELVPLSQARTMAQRLERAGVPTQLLVFAGTRHATEYTLSAWKPTVTFLRRYLRR
jgi:acetyl esterase/lipase